MQRTANSKLNRARAGESARSSTSRRVVLLVDPDSLTRWSVKSYLAHWLDVISAESIVHAGELIAGRAVDILILSDDLPEPATSEFIGRVRAENAEVSTIRTGTRETGAEVRTDASYLEKPFELAQLGRILGVTSDRRQADSE